MSPDKKAALPISPVPRKLLITSVSHKPLVPSSPSTCFVTSPQILISPPHLQPLITSSQFHYKPIVSSPQRRTLLSSQLSDNTRVSPPQLLNDSLLLSSQLSENSRVNPRQLLSDSLLLSSQQKCAVSPPQLSSKAVCRLCGEMFVSYVELWAHVTTAHASVTTTTPLTTPTTVHSKPTAILPNSPLPYPLPLLPLNLG